MRDVMTTAQVLKLYDWMKTFKPEENPGIQTRTALCLMAKKSLGFKVSTSRVADIMKELGVKFHTRLPAASPGSHDRTREVAKAVAYLFEKLGEPLPDGLKRVVNGEQLK